MKSRERVLSRSRGSDVSDWLGQLAGADVGLVVEATEPKDGQTLLRIVDRGGRSRNAVALLVDESKAVAGSLVRLEPDGEELELLQPVSRGRFLPDSGFAWPEAGRDRRTMQAGTIVWREPQGFGVCLDGGYPEHSRFVTDVYFFRSGVTITERYPGGTLRRDPSDQRATRAKPAAQSAAPPSIAEGVEVEVASGEYQGRRGVVVFFGGIVVTVRLAMGKTVCFRPSEVRRVTR
jgi:hypothetical protein